MTRKIGNFFGKSNYQLGWKIIDSYILRQFLLSFVFALSLLMTIIVVFDFSENIQKFLDNNVSFKEIIFGYYCNFIPYFVNLFIPLFTFISTIWFTSRLANHNEIISILNGGISYYRFMVPYIIGALIIAFFGILMANILVPRTNQNLENFKDEYLRKRSFPKMSIHIRNNSNSYIFLDRWNIEQQTGYQFSYEEIGKKAFKKKINAKSIHFNEKSKKWELNYFTMRTIYAGKETVVTGNKMDTVFSITPLDFNQDEKISEQMSYSELNNTIKIERDRGTGLSKFFVIEKHRRLANSFGTIILTLLGLSVASSKTQRGIGVHLFFGLALAFTFIFLQQISTVFSLSGSIPPGLGPWIPNLIFIIICIFIIRRTIK